MGAKHTGPHDPPHVPLSQETTQLAYSIFDEMDTDGSGTVDWQETFHYWKQFAKVNAQAMFDAVDADHNGEISREEWIGFWTQVRNSGHTDEDVAEELRTIHERVSWVGFAGAPKMQVRRKE
jgi:Ca2+-binding EF-hand superfamily protein